MTRHSYKTKLIGLVTLLLSLCVPWFGLRAQTASFNVTAVGTSAYRFNSQSNNPTLTLQRGVTYTFNVNAAGHPFDIKTARVTGTGQRYTSGVTGNGVQVGTLTFAVPNDAPNQLFYQCEFHPPMGGTLNIVDAPNSSPSVTITNPANGTVFTAPANVTIQASAVDTDGSVTNVQFRVGPDVLANVTAGPYASTTNGLPAGNYTLTAIASDNGGATATNSVDVVCNARPFVTITNPVPDSKFAAPADILIESDASDTDGTVTNVQFLSGGGLLGSVDSSPFVFSLNNTPAGNYAIKAIAADNYGATITSAVVNLFVLTNSTITDVTPLANGQFQLTISGIAGQMYATERATNLLNWSAFATNVAPSDVFSVTDSTSGEELLRFYRARQDF